MKAVDIVKKARYRLADIHKSRWTDERLLDALNEGISLLSLSTAFFHTTGYIKLDPNKAIYSYPEDIIRLDRVEHDHEPVKMYSFEQMDHTFGRNWRWEEHKRTRDKVEAVVYTHLRKGEFIVYPRPVLVKSDEDVYGIVTSVTEDNILDEVESTINLADNKNYLKIWYLKNPKPVTSIEDEIDTVVDTQLQTMLVSYIVSVALKDNLDTQNTQQALLEYQFFTNQINEYEKRRKHNYVNNDRRPSIKIGWKQINESF